MKIYLLIALCSSIAFASEPKERAYIANRGYLNSESHACAIDYSQCNSLEDALEKETAVIESHDFSTHETATESYLSRAETYMLLHQYEEAISDFQIAHFYLDHSKNKKTIPLAAFRITLGAMTAYDSLGNEAATAQLLEHFESPCASKQGLYSPSSTINTCCSNTAYSEIIIKTAGVDPNQPQLVWWCEATVKNTTAVLHGIALNIPRSVIRFSAIELIKS